MKLLGLLSDTQLAEQFATSHLLAVPSQYEGFGIVYLEDGVWLASNHHHFGRGKRDNHTGKWILIERDDSESLARNLHL